MATTRSATLSFCIEPTLKETLHTAAAKVDKLMALCDGLEASLPTSDDARS